MKRISGIILLALLLASCGRKKISVDYIVHHAKVYTADGGFAVLESFAVKDGKFVAVGTNASIAALYDADSLIDAGGKTILPGLIDAHCHFRAYGLGLEECELYGTKSFDEVLERVKKYAASNKKPWIVGRGWDQNDWSNKQFPTKDLLDTLFPNTPVLLKRIDGHAALCNSKALEIAGINDSTEIFGGEILRVAANPDKPKDKSTRLSGMLIDNAVEFVSRKITPPTSEEERMALLNAQRDCFSYGITSVDDAGLMKADIDVMDALQKKGELKIRIYAMLSDSTPNYNYYLKNGPYKTDRLNVRSFKFYADGALGSRGALLLEDYSDKPGKKGLLLNSVPHFKKRMQDVYNKGFQANTHCIGDSANRLILKLYASILKDSTRRWRIEHAQVVHPNDIPLFGKYGIIPSVQPVHATSDMYWAEERLGAARVKNAYAYKDLLKGASTLALGTDFPVEYINPFYTFYSAVARKDRKGFPNGGYQMNNALSRKETLLGMTQWAAWSNFEEKEKGSIEAGKFADFIITDKDPMTCPVDEIHSIKVIATYLNGENVYRLK
ncbi:MAG: amidohydrolase [Bacteroidia bacterium]